MTDHATPNLPSRDFNVTSRFYARLGFQQAYRDSGWMILVRGGVQLEFFHWPQVDPRHSIASCCLRVADARAWHASFAPAGLPTASDSIPRITAPVDQPWGFCEFAVIDPDGNLLRCLSKLAR